MSNKTNPQEKKSSNLLYAIFRFIFEISLAIIKISFIIIIGLFAGVALQKATRNESSSDYRKRIQSHFKK